MEAAETALCVLRLSRPRILPARVSRANALHCHRKGGATVNTFRITFDSGNCLVSRFNGTLHAALQYWRIGAQINTGNGASDHWEHVIRVEQL